MIVLKKSDDVKVLTKKDSLLQEENAMNKILFEGALLITEVLTILGGYQMIAFYDPVQYKTDILKKHGYSQNGEVGDSVWTLIKHIGNKS